MIKRRFIVWFALSLASCLAGVSLSQAETSVEHDDNYCVSPSLAKIRTGFTLTHYGINAAAESECALPRSSGANIDREQNIVGRYHDTDIRNRVREMLKTMHSQGATVMRTVVWYRHIEDEAMSNRKSDPLGLLVASNGKLSTGQINNIATYIADASLIGYKKFIVVLSAQGTSNPKCRQRDWGDCYNQNYNELTWSVTEQVVRAVRSSTPSEIEVIFDIVPEACVGVVLKTLVDRNLDSYSRYLIQKYKDTFGDNRFIASCGGGVAERAIWGLNGQKALFGKLGVRPHSIDIHLYEKDAEKVKNILISADTIAKELKVPLDIAETYYDHQNLFPLISEYASSGKLTSLRDILIWPRSSKSPCQISVAPPYRMDEIEVKLRRSSQVGRRFSLCEKLGK